VTVGAVVSLTVNTTVSLPEFPASSVVVTVTVCEPGPTKVPAAGLCVKVKLLSQLSEAVDAAAKSGMGALQLASAEAELSSGAVTVGAVVSLTVNVVVVVALLPASSVAVSVTEWVPSPTSVPAAGSWVTSAPQLS
jgi:hypothetical protein